MKKIDNIITTKTHLGISDSEWNKLTPSRKIELRTLSREDYNSGKKSSMENNKLKKLIKDGRISVTDLTILLKRKPNYEEKFGTKTLRKLLFSQYYRVI